MLTLVQYTLQDAQFNASILCDSSKSFRWWDAARQQMFARLQKHLLLLYYGFLLRHDI
jgi:hypothetical protein